MRVLRGRAKAVHPEVVTRPVLRAMLRACLQSPSPTVRAEMLSALRDVELDAMAISLLAAVVDDKNPIVRARLIELLSAKQTRGHATLLDHFARDSDPLVREMAVAVRGG